MAKVKITGHASGTGVITVTAPNTSTDRTITLPDATGTLLNSDGDGSSLTNLPSTSTADIRSAATLQITADDNIGLGTNAVNSITTGDYNLGFGLNAGTAITSGSNNIGIGADSLFVNNTGDNNTAVGTNSMRANTTGTGNVAIGTLAADANTTGNYLVALGRNALGANTTGHNSVAVGTEALNANTTAGNNVAVGFRSLKANTTGASNIGIGYQAGTSITTGSNNVCLGTDSGVYTTALTTGGQNTLLGHAAYTTAADADHAIVIGFAVGGADGYTTLGETTNEIRTAHGSTSWATVSDERYKKDIVDSTAGLSFVNALQPRTFKYKNLGELPTSFNAYEADSTKVFKNSNTNHGFIAQEVKAAIDADSSIKDGFRLWDDREDGSQEVAEAALIPVLVKAIQELSTKNDALEARITALES